MECLWIVDGAGSGSHNMAFDEALLEWSVSTGKSVLRFYGWNPPTLSLGYFQRYAERRDHVSSQGCPAVRRASGGGAIVHDQEVTYSLVLGGGGWSHRPQRIYDAAHDAVIEALGAHGVTAAKYGGETATGSGPTGSGSHMPSGEPFLCFQRRNVGDVICREFKVCGSAQRRKRGALLQHGSILLERSSAAPELPGIVDLTGVRMERDDLIRELAKGVCSRLELDLAAVACPEAIGESCAKLRDAKFGSEAWQRLR